MLRRIAAVITFLLLTQSPLFAQTPAADFTVSVQSAAVRRSPSVASPEIGKASRGAVLEVTRDIGAWVKVAWPEAPDGVGYVHTSMGKLSRRMTTDERLTAAFTPAATTETAAQADAAVVHSAPAPVPLSTRTVYVAPPTHFVGLGGRVGGSTHNSGSTLEGFGVSSRVWSRSRFGVQLDATRSTMKNESLSSRVTSMQFTPSVIYSLPDSVTDYIWVRPYLGAGTPFMRSALKSTTPTDLTSATDNSLGFRAFGGGELTFPSVPRFAISADLGYLWAQQSFDGFTLDGFGFSLAAHWYVK